MARKPRKKKPPPGPVLDFQIRAARLPPAEPEHRFHHTRQWRFDRCWREYMLAVEIEGVLFFGKNPDGSPKIGRHQRALGLAEDCLKYAEASALGWTVLRFTQDQVHAGVALGYIEAELRKRMARDANRLRMIEAASDEIREALERRLL